MSAKSPDPSDAAATGDSRLLSRLRETCAVAIAAYDKAPIEKQLAILMMIYRLQDHISRARLRELQPAESAAWVDAWKPQ